MTAIWALLAKVPLWAWALLVALGVIGWQHVEVSHYKGQAAIAKTGIVAVRAANVANLATIATLKAANKKWADDNAANQANAKIYADAAIEYAKQQQAAAESANAKLRAIYAQQPVVKAWADIPVPADVVRVFAGSDKD